MHIWVIGGINSGEATFNDRMDFLGSPVFRVLEIGLLAAVIYHGFDGLRLIIVHYFDVTSYRKSLFYAAFGISVILTIAGGLPIFIDDQIVGGESVLGHARPMEPTQVDQIVILQVREQRCGREDRLT